MACLQRRLQPEQDHADGDHGKVVGGALFVAGCDAAELLEAIEQALDAVALAVGCAVEPGLAGLVLRVGMTGWTWRRRSRCRAVGLL
jgi:hypothetical protein